MLTDLYRGAEKAIFFTITGMIVNSYFPLRQPALKTATIIAGIAWFFDHEADNKESLVALTVIGSAHLIHNSFFGDIGNDYIE
jgi:hypothetical protein